MDRAPGKEAAEGGKNETRGDRLGVCRECGVHGMRSEEGAGAENGGERCRKLRGAWEIELERAEGGSERAGAADVNSGYMDKVSVPVWWVG